LVVVDSGVTPVLYQWMDAVEVVLFIKVNEGIGSELVDDPEKDQGIPL